MAIRNGSIVLCVVLFLLCDSVQAGRGRGSFFSIDAGAHLSNVKERYEVQKSSQDRISTLAGFVRLRAGIALGKGWLLEPSLGSIVPWRTGKDGNVKTFLFPTQLNLLIPLLSAVRLRAGLGLNGVLITSKATSLELNNGTSTSTFFLPEGKVFSLALTTPIGFEFILSERFSANLDLAIVDIGNSDRRQFNGAFTLGFKL